MIEMIKWIQKWREGRARRIEVAADLKRFADEGRDMARRFQQEGSDPYLIYEILAKCKFLDDLAADVLSGKVEPRSKAEVETAEWPDVIATH